MFNQFEKIAKIKGNYKTSRLKKLSLMMDSYEDARAILLSQINKKLKEVWKNGSYRITN